jgi:hypothetical protein
MITSIVGWSLLITSWVIPGKTENKRLLKLILSAISFGIFVGSMLHHLQDKM